MGDNVWTRLFAAAVAFVSNLLKSSRSPNEGTSGGGLLAVQGSDVATTRISKSGSGLVIKRNLPTEESLTGEMKYNGEFVCFTLERTSVSIPAGEYETHLEKSPHFGFVTPHITVPNRTYIEIHPANYPTQLKGCVAVGSSIDNGDLDNSKAAFDRLMVLLPSSFQVTVS